MKKIESEGIEIPRGGPIYVANMVCPLLSVPDFEASVPSELRELEAELCLDSSQPLDDDVSVDELKVYTKEELVEAFKDEVNTESSLQLSKECSSAKGENTSALESSTGSLLEATCEEIVPRKNSKKAKSSKANLVG